MGFNRVQSQFIPLKSKSTINAKFRHNGRFSIKAYKLTDFCSVLFYTLRNLISRRNKMKIYYSALVAGTDRYYLGSTERGLAFVGTPNADLTEIYEFYPAATLVQDEVVNQAAKYQITEYLQGSRRQFDLPLDMENGTGLQRLVWEALVKIPWGTTLSYSALAQRIKRPGAVRAVATAVARNPLLIVVPCHRVVLKSGQVGQYRGGIAMKYRLLKLEGAIG